MWKSAYIGALASLLVCSAAVFRSAPARADWRSPIAGAPPILPARFEPRQPLRVATAPIAAPSAADAAAALSEDDSPIAWIAPLVDRRPTAAERSADIAPELLDAIARIEPIYDPTRLNGPETPPRMSVTPGTAAMDNVFADRWSRADLDPNVSQRVHAIAMAWHRTSPLPCEAFMKSRARAGYEQPALTALTPIDCALLLRHETEGFETVTLVPVVAGVIDVPTFAAPMPGSRMSSAAFWAARRAEIARVEAELKLRVVWHGGQRGITASLARR